MKTPLRYPGGKSRAVKTCNLASHALKTVGSFAPPFLGEARFEIAAARRARDTTVHGYDLFTPLGVVLGRDF